MSKNDLNNNSSGFSLTRSLNLTSLEMSSSYLEKGVALYYLGINQDALRNFDRILQQNPNDVDISTYKINILLRMNRHGEALDLCDSILNKEPESIFALGGKVCALAALGKKDEANEFYNKINKLSIIDAKSFFYKGKAAFYLEKNAEAINFFSEAIKQDKNFAEAYVSYGNALCVSNKPKEAISAFKKAIELTETYSEAYYGYGKAMFVLSNYQNALELFQKVIFLNPGSPHAYNSAGVTEAALGNKIKALEFFDKAIEKNPTNPLYYCNKGKTLNDVERSEEALKCFNKADSLSSVSKLGGGLSPGNIKHINKVLSQDRKLLIEKLKDLQEVTIRAQKVIDELAQEGSDSKHIVETFEILKRSASEATSEAINGLSMTKVPMHKQKSSNELEEKLRVQHEEMESLIAQMLQLKHQQSTYGHRLSAHEDILEASGAKAKAEIKEGFNLLKESKPELYAYCKTFYWTTINLFGAYRNLSTNLVEGNINSQSSFKEEIFIMGAKKLASYGATLAQGVPFLGGVLGAMDSIIDSLYNAFKEHKLYNKVNSINKVIQSKFGTEEDISLEVAKVAFAITYMKENEILNYDMPEQETTGSFYKAANALKNALDQMKQNILPSVELHNKHSNGAMLALKDVIAFFVYIAMDADFISSDSRSIEEQMKSIIEHGSLDKLISQASDKICNSPEIEEIADDVELTTPPLSPILTESNDIKDIEPVKIVGKESSCCCIIA